MPIYNIGNSYCRKFSYKPTSHMHLLMSLIMVMTSKLILWAEQIMHLWKKSCIVMQSFLQEWNMTLHHLLMKWQKIDYCLVYHSSLSVVLSTLHFMWYSRRAAEWQYLMTTMLRSYSCNIANKRMSLLVKLWDTVQYLHMHNYHVIKFNTGLREKYWLLMNAK